MVRRGLTSERLIGLFLFGLVLFLPPLIGVFDKVYLVRGVPLLYLYLFFAWSFLIALMAFVVERPYAAQYLEEGERAAGHDSDRGPGGAIGI